MVRLKGYVSLIPLRTRVSKGTCRSGLFMSDIKRQSREAEQRSTDSLGRSWIARLLAELDARECRASDLLQIEPNHTDKHLLTKSDTILRLSGLLT